MKLKLKYLLILALAAVLLVACSSNKEEDKASTNQNTEESVTVTDINGKVTLDKPAIKVVALEWTYVEDLLAVGIQPVGVADIQEYHNWVNIDAKLNDDVTDVGGRQEPNLEAIAALEPDLIIGVKFRHESMLKELEGIAPTVIFNPYPEDESVDHYQEMIDTFNEIAKAVNKTDEAKKVLADLDAKYEEAKEKIAKADLKTKDVILTNAYTGPQAPEIRVMTPNSMTSQIIEKIGLKNVHVPDQYEMFGSSTFNVEGLTKYEDANYLYTVQAEDNIYENQLKENAVWKNLNFVKEDRLFNLGGDTWLYGGPLSAETLLNKIVDSMVTK
ncbi:iron-siderophore ABC transporter substrate-binding protein [Sporosarcina sp. Marseille-Q4063]|uniref:ABC transporter substrate-binding protein n=1 Tax=Sporosarcina sp. Marseille-Q4063 TaxID=2810514 RepID=UPI001BAFB6F0|nr:iron-siderophore ABC transporter substrate-binding protein [Sporosarcina sp. Marseille-Q4063]QUW20692.1 iron-siderophore ABC transporter substrate-binding protein [Sporosarcina sp. Marseille-Q4063]